MFQCYLQFKATNKGESRIEQFHSKKLLWNMKIKKLFNMPTNYYAVEYQTQDFQEKYTERVEYYSVEKQIIHQQVQPIVQQVVQKSVVQQVLPQSIVQLPVIVVQSVTQASQYVAPIISSRVVPSYPQYQPPQQQVQPQQPPRSNLNVA